jgi:hypothetical protein
MTERWIVLEIVVVVSRVCRLAERVVEDANVISVAVHIARSESSKLHRRSTAIADTDGRLVASVPLSIAIRAILIKANSRYSTRFGSGDKFINVCVVALQVTPSGTWRFTTRKISLG